MKKLFVILSLCACMAISTHAVPPTLGDDGTGATMALEPEAHKTFRPAASFRSPESPVILYIYAVSVPYPTNTSAYVPLASNIVQQIYWNGAPSEELGHVLVPANISQPRLNYASNVLWFAVRVVAKDPSYKFLPGQLEFIQTSTDGLLAKTNTFTDPYYSYNGFSSLGVIWGSGSNHRLGNTFAQGYWDQTGVNEFIFIGSTSKFFVFDEAYTYDQLAGYIMSFAVDYCTTGKWVFYDSGIPRETACKTMHTKLSPAAGHLAVDVLTNAVSVAVGLTCGAGDSWVLQAKPDIRSGTWSDTDTMNSGDIFIRPADIGGSKQFWRARLQ